MKAQISSPDRIDTTIDKTDIRLHENPLSKNETKDQKTTYVRLETTTEKKLGKFLTALPTSRLIRSF